MTTGPGEHRFPCARCGAQLRYAPGMTELVCAHCDHRQPIPDAGPRRQDRALGEIPLATGLNLTRDETITAEVRTSHCPGCGAVVELTGATQAGQCPYCATPVVIDAEARRRITAQALLPFALTEDEARVALTRWLGSLWFAPNRLLDYTRKNRAMTGIYTPFWTFDAASDSRYTGQRGEHYYETRTVNVTVNGRTEQRQEQIQRTRWYPAAGRVARRFDDMLVMASQSLPKRLGDELTPWDLSALVPYAPEFIAGFQAEAYVIPLDAAHEEARRKMAEWITRDVRADIGGDAQQITRIDTDWSEESFRHILLPIWTAAYRYGGRSYQFLVNGQTGEVQGERPYSLWKIGFALLFALLVILGLLYANDPSLFGAGLDYRNPANQLPALQDWLGGGGGSGPGG